MTGQKLPYLDAGEAIAAAYAGRVSAVTLDGRHRRRQGAAVPCCPDCGSASVVRAEDRYRCGRCGWVGAQRRITRADGGHQGRRGLVSNPGADRLIEIRAVLERLGPAERAWGRLAYTDAGDELERALWQRAVVDWLFERLYAEPAYQSASPGLVKRGLRVLEAVVQGAVTGDLYWEQSGRVKVAFLERATGVDHSQFAPSRYWGAFLVVALRHLSRLAAATLGPIDQLLAEQEGAA